ncbi:MAG: hypothetical protein IT539_00610 [Bradyrhizobiaceae bacterium]|nr:hypothetical protein [Bradyrhizobiaceae bacterium]
MLATALGFFAGMAFLFGLATIVWGVLLLRMQRDAACDALATGDKDERGREWVPSLIAGSLAIGMSVWMMIAAVGTAD